MKRHTYDINNRLKIESTSLDPNHRTATSRGSITDQNRRGRLCWLLTQFSCRKRNRFGTNDTHLTVITVGAEKWRFGCCNQMVLLVLGNQSQNHTGFRNQIFHKNRILSIGELFRETGECDRNEFGT